MKKTFKKILCSLLVVVVCLTSAPLSGFVGFELPEWIWKASAVDEYKEGYYTYTVSNGEATITDVDTAIEGDISISSMLGGYSVTTIGDQAFCYCDSLTSVTIPDSVTSIGREAFWGCTSLECITVDEDNCNYSSDEYGVLFNKDKTTLICHSIGSTRNNYDIPDSVTTIGERAFQGCDSLISITIPDSVTSIGHFAFYYCTSLESILIPYSVTGIGDRAFLFCTNIKNITVDEDNNYFSSDENGVLFNKDKNCLILYPVGNARTSYIVPDSVLSISHSAFTGCSNLENVTILDSVTFINGAFESCYSLKSVTLSNNLTSIGDVTFRSCGNLESVTIPDNIISIDEQAFCDCYSLESVTIPDSVTSIGSQAFLYCTSLECITVDEDNCNYSSDEYGVLFNKDKTALIQYPIGNTRTSYTIPDSVTSIGGNAFDNCGILKSVTIGDSVTSIGSGAFKDCTNLESVTNGGSVTSIGKFAFYNCDSLENVTISDSVTSIGGYAFCACDSLTSVTIPDSVTSIGNLAFHSCTNLKNVTIPNSVTSIGDSAFYDLNHIGYEGTEEQWNKISLGVDVISESAYLHFEFDETDITETVTTPATCMREGEKSKVCSCGYVYEYGVEVLPIEPNAHLCNDEYIITKAPTCCEEGEKAVFCLLCGVKDEKSVTKIEKLAHSFSEWIVEDNKSTRYCFNCGYTETKFNTDDGDVEIEYPETPDTDFEVDEIIPTDDNYIIVDEAIGDNINVVKAFDINLKNKDGVHVQPDGTVKVKLPLDWEKEGNYKVYRVNDDGTLTDMNAYRQGSHMVFDTDHFSIYVIVHQHTYKSTIIPPSCTKQGFTTFTCACGETYIGDYVNEKGHSYSLNTVQPTCTKSGTVTTFCTSCGDTKTETIEPTGHTFEDGASKCSNCDYNKADECGCNCHKGGIAGFFFKIILFFQKLFRTNQTCSCGVNHY